MNDFAPWGLAIVLTVMFVASCWLTWVETREEQDDLRGPNE